MESSWPERIGWIAARFEDDNLRALGRRIGVTGQAVSAWTRGEARPASEALAALARTYPEINCRWLLTGRGEPLRDGAAAGMNGAAVQMDGAAPRMDGAVSRKADGQASQPARLLDGLADGEASGEARFEDGLARRAGDEANAD